jgi:hypothetical protein
VRLPSGRTLFSFEWDNFSKPDGSPQHANITICYTDDQRTWRLSATQAPVGHPMVGGVARCDGANEPTSIQLSNGTILTLIRTQTGRLWRTLSLDDGANVQPAASTAITSSDSPAMLLKLTHPSWAQSGVNIPPILMMWSNCDSSWPLACSAGGPADSSGDCLYAARWALHGAISLDDGETWRGFQEVYRDPYLRTPPASEEGDYGAAYSYGAEQADGTVIVKSGQSGVAPARWNMFKIDPRWLLRESKSADWSSQAALAAWNSSTVGDDSTVTSCLYFWNLCRDPSNHNRSAPHCDRGGDGVALRQMGGSRGICAAHAGSATQATIMWNFPVAAAGHLNIVFRLASDFAGANISLSDYLAPAFDLDTDWDSGIFSSLAVLSIKRGGYLIGQSIPLPFSKWLRLRIDWSDGGGHAIFNITSADEAEVPAAALWHGELESLKKPMAMPPSYLRVRSLGPQGICLRSAAATAILGSERFLKTDDLSSGVLTGAILYLDFKMPGLVLQLVQLDLATNTTAPLLALGHGEAFFAQVRLAVGESVIKC